MVPLCRVTRALRNAQTEPPRPLSAGACRRVMQVAAETAGGSGRPHAHRLRLLVSVVRACPTPKRAGGQGSPDPLQLTVDASGDTLHPRRGQDLRMALSQGPGRRVDLARARMTCWRSSSCERLSEHPVEQDFIRGYRHLADERVCRLRKRLSTSPKGRAAASRPSSVRMRSRRSPLHAFIGAGLQISGSCVPGQLPRMPAARSLLADERPRNRTAARPDQASACRRSVSAPTAGTPARRTRPALETRLAAALDAGMGFFDTAEVYSFGRSETALGQAARTDGRPVLVASKFAPLPHRLTAAQFESALEKTLARLGRESLDLYYLHFPYSPVGVSTWMRAMARRCQGRQDPGRGNQQLQRGADEQGRRRAGPLRHAARRQRSPVQPPALQSRDQWRPRCLSPDGRGAGRLPAD